MMRQRFVCGRGKCFSLLSYLSTVEQKGTKLPQNSYKENVILDLCLRGNSLNSWSLEELQYNCLNQHDCFLT